jgi:chromosome segregation ATPase
MYPKLLVNYLMWAQELPSCRDHDKSVEPERSIMKSSHARKPSLYPIPRLTQKTKDLPATQGLVYLVRNEMRSNFQEFRAETQSEFKKVEARFKKVGARFNEIDARFNQIDARFNQVDARFSELEARIDQVLAAVHQVAGEVARIGVLVEEQNTKNSVTLEGHTGLAQRQDRLEVRVTEVERLVKVVARGRS